MQHAYRRNILLLFVLCTMLFAVACLDISPAFAAPSTPAAADAGDMNTAPPAHNPAAASPLATAQDEGELKESAAKRLKIFGADFFTADASPFMPNPEAPVPDNYVLGAGDTVSVKCWYGSTEYENSAVKVTPQGDFYLKLLGATVAAKKTIGQLRDELKQRYRKFYTGYSLTVDLVGQRTMPVYVLGEVHKPGKYFLSGMATAFTALYSAGGPNDIGSLRHITVMRGKQVAGSIDIYDYLLHGHSVDLPLQSGDTVFLPPVGAVVALTGEVRRPARYEVQAGLPLSEALELAGGTTPHSSNRVQLLRVDAEKGRQLLDLHLPADAAFPMKDGDIVEAQPVVGQIPNAVSIRGAVYRPGEYTLDHAPTISALLKQADGVKPDAYLGQAHLRRRLANNEQTLLSVNISAALAGNAQADLPLCPFDELIIYSRNDLSEVLDKVSIEGEVVKPGEYPYAPGMRVGDLVKQAFGITRQAYLAQAMLYRFDNATGISLVSVNLERILAGDVQANLPLSARDRLVVRSVGELNYQQIKVEGEVVKPGAFPYYKGMAISDALYLANGVTADSALDRALLYRLNPQTFQEEVRDLSLRNALAHLPADDLPLQNFDRLVVFSTKQQGEFQQVTIEGAVDAPGAYQYAQGMRLHQLLYLAKNLRKNAYTRRADLYRMQPDNSVLIIPIDLTNTLTGAACDDNPILQPRDRLVIAAQSEKGEQPQVKIGGFVRRPGLYPLTREMKVSDLLDLGNGLKPEAELNAYLYRRVNGQETTVKIPLQRDGDKILLAQDPLLQADDLVTIQAIPEFAKLDDIYHIEGEVSHPGSYPVYASNKTHPRSLYAALAEAGGLLPTSYVPGIVLYRKRSTVAADMQQLDVTKALANLDAANGIIPAKEAVNEKIKIETEQHPLTPEELATPTKSAGTTTSTPSTVNPPATSPTPEAIANTQNVNNMARSMAQTLTAATDSNVVLVIPPRSMQQEYRLSIPIDAKSVLNSKGKIDFQLEPDDLIYIPKQPTTVSMIGGVVVSGSTLYRPGQRVGEYLNSVGGFAPDADAKHIIIMHLNGQVQPAHLQSIALPGDTIVIPTKHIIKLFGNRSELENVMKVMSDAAITAMPFLRVN